MTLLLFQDLMTDLNAESEPLPIRPVREEWMGHKVMKIWQAQLKYLKMLSIYYDSNIVVRTSLITN